MSRVKGLFAGIFALVQGQTQAGAVDIYPAPKWLSVQHLCGWEYLARTGAPWRRQTPRNVEASALPSLVVIL